MIDFPIDEPSGILQALPALKENPAYEVLRGDPRASIRFELGAMDTLIRAGIWRCTEGAFRCVESGDELQTIRAGRLRIERPDGSSSTFGPGDSFVTRQGEVLIWDVLEDVEKVFFTYIEGGEPPA